LSAALALRGKKKRSAAAILRFFAALRFAPLLLLAAASGAVARFASALGFAWLGIAEGKPCQSERSCLHCAEEARKQCQKHRIEPRAEARRIATAQMREERGRAMRWRIRHQTVLLPKKIIMVNLDCLFFASLLRLPRLH
jgi:hypothetical protein